MTGVEIKEEQRINLVRWHALVCPDGNSRQGKSWKKELAESLGISQSLVTKMSKAAAGSGTKGFSGETIKRLCDLEDEAFLAVLGFQHEAKPANEASSRSNRIWLQDFVRATSQEDYVDLCLENGVHVRTDQRELAKKRAEAMEKQKIQDAARWRTDDAAYWFIRRGSNPSSGVQMVPMHGRETEAINELFKKLTSSGKTSKPTTVLSLPYSGISFALQKVLPNCDGFESYYGGGTHHIHIGALDFPHDVRARLSKLLLVKLGDDEPGYRHWTVERKIAHQLHNMNELLIIHGASAIPDEALGFIKLLSDELERNPEKQIRRGVSRLILTTWDPGAFGFLKSRRPIEFEYFPDLSSTEALDYFRESLEHYRSVRGRSENKLIGPRAENSILRRAEHHYRGKQSNFTELPSAIRFRAFCASDTGNASPFDPTQGVWGRIRSDWRDSLPEITDCITDIQSDLRNFSAVSTPEDLTALRLVSTGLFFVTDNMLRKIKEYPISKSYTSGVEITFRLQSKYVHEEASEGEEISRRFSSPLLVRSIVQDDWMRFDPSSRSRIHEAVGEILSDTIYSEDFDYAMAEIPYEYPWGDGAVVFAIEAIRHFIRAASSASGERKMSLLQKALETYDEFLEQGTFTDHDQEASKQAIGLLSRSHGLHGLKYEALSLLSGDGRGTLPPLSLNEMQSFSFFREIGITLARMLRPDEAISVFEKCLQLDGLANLDRSYVLAHATSASIMIGDLKKAGVFLEEARQIESKEETDSNRAKISSRNDARSAMLSLAAGRRDEARSKWEDIADVGITEFFGDRAIGYFDALLTSPIRLRNNQSIADGLWASIERASHFSLEQGFEHERLRVDIRKASLARIIGFPRAAEAILDHVGLDLAQHSGAEILFREFQMESAETLLNLERPRYAFVAYAWPAFQSLRRRAALSFSRKSKHLCMKLLRNMERFEEEPFPTTGVSKFWREIGKASDRQVYPLFSVDLLPVREDVEKYFLELFDCEKRQAYREILNEEVSR